MFSYFQTSKNKSLRLLLQKVFMLYLWNMPIIGINGVKTQNKW